MRKVPRDLVFACVCGLFERASQSSCIVLVPLVALRLGAPVAAVGLVTAASNLAPLFLSIHLGASADRLGSRTVAVLGALVGFVFTLASGFAGSYWLLALWQFWGGVGRTATWIGAQTLVASGTGGQRRAHHVGFLSLSAQVGNLIGPVLGGLLLDRWGGRTAFTVSAAVLLVIFVAALLERVGARSLPSRAAAAPDSAAVGPLAAAAGPAAAPEAAVPGAAIAPPPPEAVARPAPEAAVPGAAVAPAAPEAAARPAPEAVGPPAPEAAAPAAPEAAVPGAAVAPGVPVRAAVPSGGHAPAAAASGAPRPRRGGSVDLRRAIGLFQEPGVRLMATTTLVRLSLLALKGSYYVVLLKDWGLSAAAIGTLLSLASMAAAVVAPLHGASRRYASSRGLLVYGLGVLALAFAVSPAAPGFWPQVAVMVVAGVATGITQPALIAVLAESVAPEEQGLGVGLRTALNRLAAFGTPTLIGALAAILPLALLFPLFGAACGVALALAPRLNGPVARRTAAD